MTHPGPPPPDFPAFGAGPGAAMPPWAGMIPEGMPPGFMPPPAPPPEGAPLADESFPGQDEPIAAGEMDPRHRVAYHGLLYLGALTGKFSYLGHSFVIRTLKSDEELLVAQMCVPWNETIGSVRAHAIAMVALAVQLVDGKTLPVPIGEQQAGEIGWAEQRFLYCRRWYSMVIDEIFNRYLELEGIARKVVSELGKGSAPEGPETTSSPSSGSPSGEAS